MYVSADESETTKRKRSLKQKKKYFIKLLVLLRRLFIFCLFNKTNNLINIQ